MRPRWKNPSRRFGPCSALLPSSMRRPVSSSVGPFDECGWTIDEGDIIALTSPRASVVRMSDKVPVDLTGAAQTMLTTLYLKALDADFERPVLGDQYAKEAVDRLDYDWREIGITGRLAPLITVRTAQYDIWARQFLAVHEDATVVHLGCGLDSRVFRIDPGPRVEWYDVDYPAVIALREKIYPARSQYHLIA